MRKIRRILMAVGAAAAAVAIAASPAQASYSVVVYVTECSYCSEVGSGQFNADPGGTWPGDSIKACDDNSDGWGILTFMAKRDDWNVRYATTSTEGHLANYCTPWKTHDLPEETPVDIVACQVKDGVTQHCRSAGAVS